MEIGLDNVLDKAFELFNRYGVKSVTMDDIARMLGMSKKTLYQHVKDKNDLVNKVVDRALSITDGERCGVVQKNLSAIDEFLEITYLMNEHFKDYNPTFDFDLRKYYPLIHQKLEDAKRERIYEGISKNLLKGISEGTYRENIDVDIITKVFVLRFENAFENTIFTKEEITSSKVFREIMIYHLHGICNSKGVKIVEQKLKEHPFLNAN